MYFLFFIIFKWCGPAHWRLLSSGENRWSFWQFGITEQGNFKSKYEHSFVSDVGLCVILWQARLLSDKNVHLIVTLSLSCAVTTQQFVKNKQTNKQSKTKRDGVHVISERIQCMRSLWPYLETDSRSCLDPLWPPTALAFFPSPSLSLLMDITDGLFHPGMSVLLCYLSSPPPPPSPPLRSKTCFFSPSLSLPPFFFLPPPPPPPHTQTLPQLKALPLHLSILSAACFNPLFAFPLT